MYLTSKLKSLGFLAITLLVNKTIWESVLSPGFRPLPYNWYTYNNPESQAILGQTINELNPNLEDNYYAIRTALEGLIKDFPEDVLMKYNHYENTNAKKDLRVLAMMAKITHEYRAKNDAFEYPSDKRKLVSIKIKEELINALKEVKNHDEFKLQPFFWRQRTFSWLDEDSYDSVANIEYLTRIGKLIKKLGHNFVEVYIEKTIEHLKSHDIDTDFYHLVTAVLIISAFVKKEMSQRDFRRNDNVPARQPRILHAAPRNEVMPVVIQPRIMNAPAPNEVIPVVNQQNQNVPARKPRMLYAAEHNFATNLVDKHLQEHDLIEDYTLGEAKIKSVNNEYFSMIPDEYLCKLTHELMRDPVTTETGQVYDRKEIEAWFAIRTTAELPLTDPMTDLICFNKLIPCLPLRKNIRNYLDTVVKESREFGLTDFTSKRRNSI